ncbi:uncharacterized protein TNCV_1486041 [Trichonephila clavipes]|nr:uncharacterized protein TNCV_1486041 [Trichonephila clavipes]
MQIIRISAQTHITRACGATSNRYLRLGDFDDFKFGNCVFLPVFSKNDQLCLVENRSAFDQVSEFDRGRIVAYRDIVEYLSGKSVVMLDETEQL